MRVPYSGLIPRSVRRRPRYKSAAWHPIPNTGLRGEAGWKRGDRVNESVFPDDIDTDELCVNIDDVDDDDIFVNGASAYLLPTKPFCLIGVAKLKPFGWNSRGCGIFRIFGESNDKSEPASHIIMDSIDVWVGESNYRAKALTNAIRCHRCLLGILSGFGVVHLRNDGKKLIEMQNGSERERKRENENEQCRKCLEMVNTLHLEI